MKFSNLTLTKKLLIPSILSVIVAVSTAFGQGYATFGGGPRVVLNEAGPESGFDATFLWSATATVAPIYAIAPSSPQNGTVLAPPSVIWADIENLTGGWQFAVDAGTGSNVIARPVNNLGSFSYASGAAFPLSGSTGAGQVISIYAIAWDTGGGLYTTLAAAEAGDAFVGWSSVFQYTLGAAPPATPPPQTVVPAFGIDTPEPTTLALAAVGGIAMFLFRRRKA